MALRDPEVRMPSPTLFSWFPLVLSVVVASLWPVQVAQAAGVAPGQHQAEVKRTAWCCSMGCVVQPGPCHASEDSLRGAGYQVYNRDYPSTQATVEALAASEIRQGLDWCQANARGQVHFVTHSMGGILVRAYLQDNQIEQLGRIVMLSPPNHGSEVVDRMQDWWLFEKLTGPAGQQLGTGADGVTASLAPIPGEIGIIMGNRTVDPWLSWMIPGRDDGKVSLDGARLAEMKDFIVMPASHAFIMRKKKVIQQIVTFLQQGKFRVALRGAE